MSNKLNAIYSNLNNFLYSWLLVVFEWFKNLQIKFQNVLWSFFYLFCILNKFYTMTPTSTSSSTEWRPWDRTRVGLTGVRYKSSRYVLTILYVLYFLICTLLSDNSVVQSSFQMFISASICSLLASSLLSFNLHYITTLYISKYDFLILSHHTHTHTHSYTLPLERLHR